jgi:hypothetical protein
MNLRRNEGSVISDMPAAEVDIDERLVRRLLASQFPPW